MKTLFKLLFVALLFASCDDVEPTIYHGNADSDPTFLSFSQTVYSMPVIRDGVGSVDITLNSSTKSTVDRTYTLEIDADQTDAAPDMYTLPGTITIPAGAYQGKVTVTGQDNNVTPTSVPLVFKITGLTNESLDSTQATIRINIFEVCPLQAAYTGNYRFNQITSPVSNGPQQIFLFEQGSIVQVSQGSNEFERQFTADVWPGFFDIPVTLSFTLSCDQINVSPVDIGAGCTPPEGQDPVNFLIGEPDAPGTYSANDSFFTVRVKEDALGSCLSAGRQVSFTLTKVD